MSPITTHVLDTAVGTPAKGVAIHLEFQENGGWVSLARRETDADGRVRDLLPSGSLKKGRYRLTFAAGAYWRTRGVTGFYDDIPIEFLIEDASAHYHVPLLLSPFGYSTYRGS